jgi:hypothetical protein
MSRQFIATYNRIRPSLKERYQALKNDQVLRGMPIGVVVATRNDEGKVCFGYSMCDPYDYNRHFTKKRAIEMALGRALDEKVYPIPNGLKKVLTPEFLKRCETYFKEEGLIAPLIKTKSLSKVYLSNVTVNNVATLDGDYFVDPNGALKNK